LGDRSWRRLVATERVEVVHFILELVVKEVWLFSLLNSLLIELLASEISLSVLKVCLL
jgi:hypothetical protein